MSFASFSFHTKINSAIEECGYTAPTPIQTQAIPPVLAGGDLLGLAQTGTGKTAAFVLPILERLLAGPRKRVRALIMAPTRELAEQIHRDIAKMGKNTGLRSVTIYGGVGKGLQIKNIKSGVEIVVACPGRLLDHLREKVIDLSQVEILVLDEADHLFDMGFLPDIRRIIQFLPRNRQTLLFSATMPSEIRHLADDVLTKPTVVQVDHTQPVESIKHVLFQVEKPRRTALLKNLLAQSDKTATLVFTRTKHQAKNLARQLETAGFSATAIQGNLSQSKRQQALDGFREGTYHVLVATDIAARGIDVAGISHVINYDVPDTVEAYTHRIGRTGRAERTGEAYTFAGREDQTMIRDIERTLGQKMGLQPLPAHLEMAQSMDETKPQNTRGPQRAQAPRNQAAKYPSSARPGSSRQGQRQRQAPLGFDARNLGKRSGANGKRSSQA